MIYNEGDLSGKKKKKYIYIYIYVCVCVCVFQVSRPCLRFWLDPKHFRKKKKKKKRTK